MKNLLALFCLSLALNSFPQTSGIIIPQPLSIAPSNGNFTLNSKTRIFYNKNNESSILFLNEHLIHYYGLKLVSAEKSSGIDQQAMQDNSIQIVNVKTDNPEAYQLNISENKITILAEPAGVFYAIQTLIQLLPFENEKTDIKKAISIPCMTITDKPRFGYRGMHLDVSRHFFGPEQIKRYIDDLALHKFNTFHWHLTDDQGWRIEIRKHPELTTKGSCRDQTLVGSYGIGRYDSIRYCGYYTQQEIKEIVRYASDRFINIIPEIEMPGHSMALLTANPSLGCTKGPYQVRQTWGVSSDVLCAGNDSTYKYLEEILEEVITLFPSRYIHIGGDECPKDRWHDCKLCQQKIIDEHLKDEHELQSFFIGKIEKFLNSKGKNIIGWDEILEGGLAPNATVMSWRGTEGGISAAKQHHFAIMTPGTPLYFDHSQSINEDSITNGGNNKLKTVYDYNPIPKELTEEESRYILGGQANMWTEYMTNWRKVEYMLFPRIAALSEALWTSPDNKSWKRFETEMPGILKRYDFWGLNYSRAFYDLQTGVSRRSYQRNVSTGNYSTPADQSNPIGVQWDLKSKDSSSHIFISRPYFEAESTFGNKVTVPVIQSGQYQAILLDKDNNVIGSPVKQDFQINLATGKNVKLLFQPSNNYSTGGVLTLVDGIRNTGGMSKSHQFLGFSGDDLDATIDLGRMYNISSVILHLFEQEASWIYKPSKITIYISDNGNDFQIIDTISHFEGKGNFQVVSNKKTEARFIRIVAENYGMIPMGHPGGGNKAWLFVDEIEVY